MRVEFSNVIEELAHGDVNRQASEQLAEVVAAVEATGKKGRIVISVSVTKEGTHCVLDADIKTTKPQVGSPATMFFFGKDGAILRDDPRQLDLRSIYRPNEVPVDATKGTPDDE